MNRHVSIIILSLIIVTLLNAGCICPTIVQGILPEGGHGSTSPTITSPAPSPAIIGNTERVKNEYTSVGTVKSTTVTKYVINHGAPGNIYLSLSDKYTKNTSSLIFFMDRGEVVAISYRTGGIMVSTMYDLTVRNAAPSDHEIHELTGNLYITRNINASEYQ